MEEKTSKEPTSQSQPDLEERNLLLQWKIDDLHDDGDVNMQENQQVRKRSERESANIKTK